MANEKIELGTSSMEVLNHAPFCNSPPVSRLRKNHFMSERFGSKIASTPESVPIMGNLSDTKAPLYRRNDTDSRHSICILCNSSI